MDGLAEIDQDSWTTAHHYDHHSDSCQWDFSDSLWSQIHGSHSDI